MVQACAERACLQGHLPGLQATQATVHHSHAACVVLAHHTSLLSQHHHSTSLQHRSCRLSHTLSAATDRAKSLFTRAAVQRSQALKLGHEWCALSTVQRPLEQVQVKDQGSGNGGMKGQVVSAETAWKVLAREGADALAEAQEAQAAIVAESAVERDMCRRGRTDALPSLLTTDGAPVDTHLAPSDGPAADPCWEGVATLGAGQARAGHGWAVSTTNTRGPSDRENDPSNAPVSTIPSPAPITLKSIRLLDTNLSRLERLVHLNRRARGLNVCKIQHTMAAFLPDAQEESGSTSSTSLIGVACDKRVACDKSTAPVAMLMGQFAGHPGASHVRTAVVLLPPSRSVCGAQFTFSCSPSLVSAMHGLHPFPPQHDRNLTSPPISCRDSPILCHALHCSPLTTHTA
jgi:hypothetical protein